MLTSQSVAIETLSHMIKLTGLDLHRIFGRIAQYAIYQPITGLLPPVITTRCEIGEGGLHVHRFRKVRPGLLHERQYRSAIVANRNAYVARMPAARAGLLAVQQDGAQQLIARSPMHVEGGQPSGGEEEWLTALALRCGIVWNVFMRHFALQRQLVSQSQEELLQAQRWCHVAVITGKQAVVAGFEARVPIASMLAQSQRHVERHPLIDDAQFVQFR